MAKKNAHTPQNAAADAGVKGLGRVRQMFSRKGKQGVDAAAGAAAAGTAMTGAAAAGGKGALKTGVMTHAAVGADRAVGRAHGAISRVNSFVYYGGFLAGGLATLGKIPGIGKVFESASNVASRPREYMDNTTVRDALHTPSTLVSNVREAAKSRALKGAADPSALLAEDGALKTEGLKGTRALAAKVANRVGGASAGVEKGEEKLFGALKTGAGKVFDPLGDAAGKVGEAQRLKLAERIAGKAGKQHEAALGAIDELMGHGKGDEAFSPVRGALEKAKGLLGDGSKKLGKDDMTAFQEAIGSAREGLSEVSMDKKALSGIQKGLSQVEEAGSAFTRRAGTADKLRDISGTVKNAPKALADANLTNVALKGAVVTGTTLQVTSTARGIAEKVHSLKQMHCDLTGDEKISTRKLLMSKKVPNVIKEARGHIMKEFGPRVVLNFANTVATYGFMKNNSKSTMLVSGGLMALSQLHSAKVQGYELLPMYDALNQQPQIQDMQYAAFISAASKDAAKAGGIESALVQALAGDYAKEGTRPAEILNEIQDGRFDERAMQKAQQNRAAMEAMGGHELADKTGAPQQGPSSSAAAGREVVGTHTQRLQGQMAGRQQQPESAPQLR